jgi:hypothetical protein
MEDEVPKFVSLETLTSAIQCAATTLHPMAAGLETLAADVSSTVGALSAAGALPPSAAGVAAAATVVQTVAHHVALLSASLCDGSTSHADVRDGAEEGDPLPGDGAVPAPPPEVGGSDDRSPGP